MHDLIIDKKFDTIKFIIEMLEKKFERRFEQLEEKIEQLETKLKISTCKNHILNYNDYVDGKCDSCGYYE